MVDVQECAAAILLKDNKILLGKRAARRRMYPGYWDLVGGHCEPDESPKSALLRELREELNICATDFRLLDVLDEPLCDAYGKYRYYVYLVTGWCGNVCNAQLEEHSDLQWFTFEQTGLLKLAHPSYPALFKGVVGEIDD